MVNYFGRGYLQTTGACPNFETDFSSWRVDLKLLTDSTFLIRTQETITSVFTEIVTPSKVVKLAA